MNAPYTTGSSDVSLNKLARSRTPDYAVTA